jgi:hypothetical protein
MEAVERFNLKIEGIDKIDIRFLSNFLYNFKAYVTVLSKVKKLDNENFFNLSKYEQFFIMEKYDIEFIKKREIQNAIREINLFIEPYISKYKKYNLFLSDEVILEISSIRKGSWLLKFLLRLSPEQIRAYGDAIAKIIIAIGLVLSLYNLSKNPKMVKYLRDIAIILLSQGNDKR